MREEEKTASHTPTACPTQMYSSCFKVVVLYVVAPSRLAKRYGDVKEPVHCVTRKNAVAGNNIMFGIIYKILRRHATQNSKCIFLTILTITIPC